MTTSKALICPHCGSDLAGTHRHAGSAAVPPKLQRDGHGEGFVWCATCHERVYLSVMSTGHHQHGGAHHRHHAGHGSGHHA